MLNPFFFFDNGDYTYIGRTVKISISGFYIDKPYVKVLFIDFVAEYKVAYGTGFYPANEDRLIMADFDLRDFSNGSNAPLNTLIDEQFTFIISFI
jgi:hypothetical protein